jgi:CIC family chloride channel protein
LVGVAAGLSAIVFFSALRWASEFFLGMGAGYYPPLPVGEGATVVTTIGRRWMIPVVTTLGGLISGLIVFKLAPEAEGHGTDAAIQAFHQKAGEVRTRIPLVKLVASAITIGSGGSAGREGPTAQITAGVGSLIGRVLKLNTRDRRIAVSAGIGAGIGAIFRAPLGGALLSTEILYLNGFEIAALIPSFIASIVGYTIFASWAGFTPIFGGNLGATFTDPFSLLYYIALGLLCGFVGILYPRVFYFTRDVFRSLPLPNYLKVTIGGLGVGLIGLFLPEVLGMGYGWMQLVMQPDTMLPLGLTLGLVFAKILATSLSIGSGGSGGVFAPGLFIGGMLGASLWSALNGVAPNLPPTPASFVVVGMMALFGAVARSPLAVMLMVSEMTGSYAMLAPAMIAVGISYVIVGRNTIYESQVESPAESPAHRYEYYLPLLSQFSVKDAMKGSIVPVGSAQTVGQVEKRLHAEEMRSLPVVAASSDKLIGIISMEDILRIPRPSRSKTRVAEVMSTNVVTASIDDSLDKVLEFLNRNDVSNLPVVERSEKGLKLIGMVSRRDVIGIYCKTAETLYNPDMAEK